MIKEFYNNKLGILRAHNTNNPELDLRVLIKESSKVKNFLFLKDLDMKDIDLKKFESYFNKRINGQPISKIIMRKEFWDLDFYTNRYVLDPRPETELIIENILRYYPNKNHKLTICDLGTGTGCIIITLLKNFVYAVGTAVDISDHAIRAAKKNSLKHSVKNRINFLTKDWNLVNGTYDIIVSNPPYISKSKYTSLSKEVKKYDPKIALLGGEQGFEKFFELSKIAKRCMNKSSIFLTEIDNGQAPEVEKIFFDNDLQLVEIIKDLQGINRVMIFKKTT